MVLKHGVTTDIVRGEIPGGVLTTKPGRSKQQKVIGSIAGVGPNVSFGVHNNNLVNLKRGLVERVFCVDTQGWLAPVQPALPGIYEQRLGKFRNLLVDFVPYAAPRSLEEFPLMYQGRKRTIYQKAVDSLKVKPLTRTDSYLSTFLKAEKINFSRKPDPAPRVIQPRLPRYNASMGRFIKPLEHRLYSALAQIHGSPVVSKGFSIDQVGQLIANKWQKFSNPIGIGLDASRFDQHVGVQALQWEHSIYTSIFRSSELH